MDKATLIEDIFEFGQEPIIQSQTNKIKIDDNKSIVRSKINKIYDGFVMIKVGQHQSYGIWKALVDGLTMGNNRFIVAIVPNDRESIKTQKYLSSLNWVSFQTRETKNILKEFNYIKVNPQSYRIGPDNNITDKVTLTSETENSFIYTPDTFPATIEVLRLKDSDNFATKGTVTATLELYQTIITIDN
jgi:hypothetical protein